jgi:hypothetical protein
LRFAVGDAFDNALAESEIGLFKTEVIRPNAPWKGLDHVELAVREWVDWHNHRRLHNACYDLPPAEYEQIHYGHTQPNNRLESQQPESPDPPGRFNGLDEVLVGRSLKLGVGGQNFSTSASTAAACRWVGWSSLAG